MKKIKNNFLFYLVIFITFYLLPALFLDSEKDKYITLLLLLFPIVTLLISMIYGKNNGIKWYFSFILAIIFIPTIFIYYNTSALVYSLFYLIISLLGQILGYIIEKIVKNI